MRASVDVKLYRRNWMIGVTAVLCGVVVYLVSSPGTLKTRALYAINTRLIRSGFTRGNRRESSTLVKNPSAPRVS